MSGPPSGNKTQPASTPATPGGSANPMNGKATDTSGRAAPKPPAPMDRSSIGPQLRAAREARGWNLDHIESLTKVRAGLLTHLENGEFDRLPEPIYTQSYLKAYAQAVGLPLEPLLEAYRRVTPNAPVATSPVVRRQPARAPVQLGGWLLGALAVAALGAYLFLSLRSRGDTVAPVAPPAPEVVTPQPETPPAPQTVTLSVTSTPPGATVLLDRVRIGITPMQNQPVTAGPGRELRIELEGYQPGVQTIDLDRDKSFDVSLAVQPPKPTGTAATPPGASTPNAPIVLAFSGPSWVRITDATGKRLFEGTPKAGETKSFTGPITVRVGRPDLVSATVNGQAKGVLGPTASPSTIKLP